MKRARRRDPSGAQGRAGCAVTVRVRRSSVRQVDAFGSTLDAYKYVGFEDQFRGSQDAIRARLESYSPFFDGRAATRATCSTSAAAGASSSTCSARTGFRRAASTSITRWPRSAGRAGLNVTRADAVTYLRRSPDASLGGIFAAQVVEHLEPAYLLRFLELAFEKLRPGGRLVLETINPACWTAFFESYIRDITHRWALHPETLKYLALASGFSRADIEFRSPVPPQDRLQPVAVAEGADDVIRDLAEAFNGNVEKLNARMFTHMDYAVIAEKG